MRNWAWFFVVVGCCLSGCGDDSSAAKHDAATDGGDSPDGATNTGGSDALYAPDHQLEVELTLDAADWAKVRAEGRTLEQVFSGCDDSEFAYTVVAADARIDGKHVGKIAVRKKGYLGSLSILRPSLHLDIAEYSKDLRVQGAKVITLNNSRQDPSFTHTCMSYAVFAKAGVPAPRCSFAHVSVNGEDLGTYINVEPIKKPMLARYFDDGGNLYEGAGGADFRDDMLAAFEQKTNTTTPSQAALVAVTEALKQTGSARIDALEKLIDMNELLKFWAIESLVSHWDGYTGDLNNFFVYERTDTHKLVFLPWGTDAAFVKDHGFLPEVGRPLSVLAWAHLPNVLYADTKMRDRYRAELGKLLDEVWDEPALLDEVDRIAEIAGEHAIPKALDAQRAFIKGRRAELKAELDAKQAPTWDFPERPHSVCVMGLNTPASGTFETKWGNLNALAADPGLALTLQIDGKAQKLTGLMAAAGDFEDQATGATAPALRVIGFRSDGMFVLVQISFGKRTLAPGEIPLHGLESVGFVALGTTATSFKPVALISEGSIVLDQAGMKPGDVISGHFTAQATRVNLPGGNPVVMP